MIIGTDLVSGARTYYIKTKAVDPVVSVALDWKILHWIYHVIPDVLHMQYSLKQ